MRYRKYIIETLRRSIVNHYRDGPSLGKVLQAETKIALVESSYVWGYFPVGTRCKGPSR